MRRPIDVQVADVWRESTRVGTITRTASGSIFEYTEEAFAAHAAEPGGVALHLPWHRRRTETRGANLHSYFAGLLPEGLRLRVLVSRIKTSADDLLSLLIAAGADTVGDLSVLPQGAPLPSQPSASAWKPGDVVFAEVLAESLAAMGAGSAEPTVPGVQEKISASTISLPLRPAGRGAFILKVNPADKPRLVENEAFFMAMARACGLRTANARLVCDREGNPGLLVERFDRSWDRGGKRLRRIHQEDACQFLDRYPADKYRIHCAQIAEGLQEFAAAPIAEVARFLQLLAFSYLIANGDLHAKNVSLLADGPRSGFRLSPAYDLLSTLPYGDTRMALPFEGRDDNFRRAHFVAFGTRFGVKPPATERMLDLLCEKAGPWLERLDEIGLEPRQTAHLRRTMAKRIEQLAG